VDIVMAGGLTEMSGGRTDERRFEEKEADESDG
jgi:hypothetical protein